MGKTAFIFPGQGAQCVRMGKDFYEGIEVSKKIFDKAEEILDFDIKSVCFEENALINETEYTQAAILTASMAMYEAVKQLGIRADVCCGLSLGEYNAIVSSGAMNFVDALKVVRKRGIFMQEAVPSGKGTMMAVLGMDNETAEKICSETEGIVSVANYNCPGQIVISGEKEAVINAGEHLKENGAKRVIELNVSGPFHSAMLTDAGKKLGGVLKNIEINTPEIPYVANVNASYITDKENIKELLEKQVSMSVRFEQSVRKMIADGVDTFIEIGPGKTLSGLVKKTDRNVKVMNVNCVEDLKNLVEII